MTTLLQDLEAALAGVVREYDAFKIDTGRKSDHPMVAAVRSALARLRAAAGGNEGELVKRLRSGAGHTPEDIADAERDMDDAADRIEALTLERDGERIVRAAVRIGVAIYSVPQPGGHHTIINEVLAPLELHCGPDDQGFLTNTGRFVARVEAKRIANAARQIIRHSGSGPDDPKLYSEDLW